MQRAADADSKATAARQRADTIEMARTESKHKALKQKQQLHDELAKKDEENQRLQEELEAAKKQAESQLQKIQEEQGQWIVAEREGREKAAQGLVLGSIDMPEDHRRVYRDAHRCGPKPN